MNGGLVIRAMMELIVNESLPMWRSYDATQRGMAIGLFAMFVIVGGCVVVLGISEIRRSRMEGTRIRSW
jgi:hypothetical protein